jgi:hypothetical protein
MLHKLTSGVVAGVVASGAMALASPPFPIVPSPALAETVITDSCVGTRGLESCVTTFRKPSPNPHIIHVPMPISEQDVAEQRQRDKRWEERCRPTITQDRFGVQRYVYAAQGCEFGRLN